MTPRPTVSSVSPVLVLLVLFTAIPVVQALDDPFAPSRMKVDCNKVENIVCRECCLGGIECPGAEELRTFCCRDPDRCTVIPNENDDPSMVSFPDIRLDLVVGGARLVFERKERVVRTTGAHHYEITVQQMLRPLGRGSRFEFRATLAGADAAVGSLLYAVDFLDRGLNALGRLQANGLDVALVGTPPAQTCPAAFRETCALLGRQLSDGINASLAVGTAGEREPFLQGLLALGHTR
jgi:hypothetical protein